MSSKEFTSSALKQCKRQRIKLSRLLNRWSRKISLPRNPLEFKERSGLPVLTIIAGPNGAGKSTHSKELLSDFGIEALTSIGNFTQSGLNSILILTSNKVHLNALKKLCTERRAAALDKKQNFALS